MPHILSLVSSWSIFCLSIRESMWVLIWFSSEQPTKMSAPVLVQRGIALLWHRPCSRVRSVAFVNEPGSLNMFQKGSTLHAKWILTPFRYDGASLKGPHGSFSRRPCRRLILHTMPLDLKWSHNYPLCRAREPAETRPLSSYKHIYSMTPSERSKDKEDDENIKQCYKISIRWPWGVKTATYHKNLTHFEKRNCRKQNKMSQNVTSSKTNNNWGIKNVENNI